MSFELPANLEHDLAKYAEAEQISMNEAATKIFQIGFQARKQALSSKAPKHMLGVHQVAKDVARTKPSKLKSKALPPITAEELDQLRAIPTFAFFEELPDSVAETMKLASKQLRAESLTRRDWPEA